MKSQCEIIKTSQAIERFMSAKGGLMKRFTIKSKKAGQQSWMVLENVPIYATNFTEAKKKFRERVIEWFEDVSNDDAINFLAEAKGLSPRDTYCYDSEMFTIRRLR